MSRPGRLALVLVLAVMGTVGSASSARADDASVKAAWDSEDAAFASLGRSERREIRSWQRRGFVRDGKLLRLYKRGEELSRKVVAALNAQQPSSPAGTQARALAIESTTHFVEFFVSERRFVRAMRPGKARAARRAEQESIRLDRLTRRKAAEVVELFKSIGIDRERR